MELTDDQKIESRLNIVDLAVEICYFHANTNELVLAADKT